MKNTICQGIAIFFAVAMGIFFGWVMCDSDTPPTRTEFAEMVSQTNTMAIFTTEDGHLFSADVGELLELHTNYILVFDTNKTADRTDDIILSVSKIVK